MTEASKQTLRLGLLTLVVFIFVVFTNLKWKYSPLPMEKRIQDLEKRVEKLEELNQVSQED